MIDLDRSRLEPFVRESNLIEGICRKPLPHEIGALELLLTLPRIRVRDLSDFVFTNCRAELRIEPGMDVRVGGHTPQPGGPGVLADLEDLLAIAYTGNVPPYELHLAFEQLHPYMDGNGRSGRALWAWMMIDANKDPFSLSFLHRFYYQALEASRG